MDAAKEAGLSIGGGGRMHSIERCKDMHNVKARAATKVIENWLPDMDSNHDLSPGRAINDLSIVQMQRSSRSQ